MLVAVVLIALDAAPAPAAPVVEVALKGIPQVDLGAFIGWRGFLHGPMQPLPPAPPPWASPAPAWPLFMTDPLDEIPVSPESTLLERGHRNPWMAGLASLILPGAGQFYDAATPYAFTLRGFDLWMYSQGGVHVAVGAVAILQQFVGTRLIFAGGGGVYEISERTAQAWRITYLANAVIAAASAFIEARVINKAGRTYVMGTRMGVFFDPFERAAGIELRLRI